MIRTAASFLAALALAACTAVPAPNTPTRARQADSDLPPVRSFTRSHPTPPQRSNANIAADFLSLHFELESGRPLPTFTRFETPITVRVTGAPPPTLGPDLARLLTRLRNEAGIDIRQVREGDANITIEAVSREQIRRALPQAACFVVPNVSSLEDFRRHRRDQRTNWSLLTTRTRLGIFLPNDAAPQEVRDCLHEELAQALGPLNDLYRLPDSVFNDDNVHTVLTGFDMLILRATYAPELYSGMSASEVAAELPDLLSRLNPHGDFLPVDPVSRTPRSWINNVQTTLGPTASLGARRTSANAAVRTAAELGWQDHRRAFGHYMLGRIAQATDPIQAQQNFDAALAYLDRTPGADLHRAYIVTQTAAHALARGDAETALKQIRSNIGVAYRAENAALLSTLMMLEAEALDLQGQGAKARTVRLDSLGWARYGFGSDWAVRAKMREIAALNPRRRAES
ncbi:DUF2927 domain-containing protein [Pukyongiella litopenaei]|uniref:DUF2927 domain-containing protein n=1 Tax=Pukyongiella litopenaei TaxID=2605946 RepID=A0A2S0MT99_9RHOB|nr:DUF2927 domain-containing protein [Pukyongiella litopenaei]AVO39116.1 DUF2927 domain-containing protein [Pukyongiella litopenaei]